MEIIKRYWAPRIADTIRTMRSMTDGSGVCFDIYSNQADGFMDNFTHLKSTQSRRVDFEVSRCKTLPDLEGGSGDSGHQSSYNRGPQGGSGGGGYNGNSGARRNGGGGGYGDRGGDGGGRGGGNSGYGGSKRRDERDYNGGGGQGASGGAGWSGSAGGGGGAASGGWGGGGSGWTKDPSSFVTPMYKKQLLNDNPIEISEDSTDGGNTPIHNCGDGKIIYLTNLSYNTNEHSLMDFLIK